MDTRSTSPRLSALPAEGAQRANRLVHETSPYLLQHAHNPVDWRPWGEQAFAEARRRDVPVFLSIGYSTCYWCHVMERESFENAEVAGLINDAFVPIKVDREERPDVDELYMAATVVMTGHGGWPMTCFLDPIELRPFWCGTYFPPEPRGNLPGLPQVLGGIARAWKQQRSEVLEQASQVAEAVGRHLAPAREPAPVGRRHVQQAVQGLLAALDRANGGFGGAPKFPQPVYLDLLLAARAQAGDDATRHAIDSALRLTLDRMAVGGIFDHVGGGFHRYAVDAHWTVPHFEKMLYDNAQLAGVYTRAAATYDDEFYRDVARRTLDYVLREMRHEQGGFFSAQDAEVNRREGLNYLWTREQVEQALAADLAPLAARAYGLDRGPNFQDPHHPEDGPKNVLRLAARPDRLAEELELSPDDFSARMSQINATLLEARLRRDQPATDDKVLAAWNGLMIAAMAEAGALLDDPQALGAARDAASFCLENMSLGGGVLARSWRGGRLNETPAVLEDYACMVRGLLALHCAERRAGGEADRWLRHALELLESAERQFGDGEGGYYDTRADQSDLFLRTRSTHDGATPSPSGVMLNNLVTLHELTGQAEHLDRALAVLRSISAAVDAAPLQATNAVRALLRLLNSEAARADARTFSDDDQQPPPPSAAQPVEVFADTDHLHIGPDEPAEFNLRLRIAEGCHILAADPGHGADQLFPTRVGVAGGAGVAAYADYPRGEAWGREGELRVYRGEVEMRVAVERTGEWSGRPVLVVTYQACTERECLAPRTVALDVTIDNADEG